MAGISAGTIRRAMLTRAMAEKARQMLGRGRRTLTKAVGSARAGAAKMTKSPRVALKKFARDRQQRTLNYLAEERVRTLRGRKVKLNEEELVLRERLLDAIMQGQVVSWDHLKQAVEENGIRKDMWTKFFTKTERSMIWQLYHPKRIGFVLRVPSPH